MYHECQQLTAFLAGNLSPVDCRRFEEHVASCQECAQRIELQSAKSRVAIDSRIKHADSQIELPLQLEARIGQVLVNQENSVHRAPTNRFAMGLFSIVLVASLCATFLGGQYLLSRHVSVMSSQANIERSTNKRTQEESRSESYAENTVQVDSGPASESVGFRPSLIARQGFLVAEQTNPEDEIPFYWVLPVAPRESSDPSTDNNSL